MPEGAYAMGSMGPGSAQPPAASGSQGGYQAQPGGVFAPGSSAGTGYAYPTYNQQPLGRAPQQWNTVNTPIMRYDGGNDPHKPMADRWTQTGTNSRRVANPNYNAQMRNRQAQDLINQYTGAMNTANQANQQRYEDILGGYRELGQQASGAHDSRMSNISDMYNHMGNTINQGYQDRYDTGMGMLEGLGETERGRINRSYDNQVNSIGVNLTNRGLNNSTIAGNMQNATNRNREESQGMLSEMLRREQLGTHNQLSGDQMQAQYGIMGQGAQMMDNAYGQSVNDQLQIPQSQLDFMERRTDEAPSLESLIQLYMQLGRGF